VKTVEGINDFATMKEVVTRRYRRLIEEEASLPQLIIIDGGKGQLNAAVEALKEMDHFGKTTVIGLAKNEEELFFPGDKESVKLAYNGESLKLIRRIRDEVHRFGVTFHRQLRSKGTIKNELQNIKVIGRQTADLLMKTFKSVKKIKETDEAELVQLIGGAKTKLIKEYFSNAAKQ
jgi:excinuclease ABC subunit C